MPPTIDPTPIVTTATGPVSKPTIVRDLRPQRRIATEGAGDRPKGITGLYGVDHRLTLQAILAPGFHDGSPGLKIQSKPGIQPTPAIPTAAAPHSDAEADALFDASRTGSIAQKLDRYIKETYLPRPVRSAENPVMKNIKLAYFTVFAVLTVLWFAADTLIPDPYEFFKLRATLMNFTGILAMGAMSVAIILATRPVAIESFVGGLDKTYRLHKWLGITALVVSIIHWGWAQIPRWLVGWGWLVKPAKKPRVEESVEIFRFLRSQRGLAEQIGEWAFYVAVVLIVLALVKRFPYRHFFKTHRLLAIVYLFLVFHSVVLIATRAPAGARWG